MKLESNSIKKCVFSFIFTAVFFPKVALDDWVCEHPSEREREIEFWLMDVHTMDGYVI